MPRCTDCQEEKSPDEMVKNRSTKSGLGSYCLPCNRTHFLSWRQSNLDLARDLSRKSRKAWIEAHREEKRMRDQKYYEENHERVRDQQIGSRLKSRYGITLEDYEQMLAAQQGRCAICREARNQRLCVDHDHETGKVRGLLCRACNFRLGSIEKPGLEAFLAYLS